MARRPNAQLAARTHRRLESSRSQLLDELHGHSDIAFIRLRGNRGDELIWAGARALLREVDYREVDPEKIARGGGELALVSGSGGWCEDFHGYAPDVLQEAERHFERVVLLPSTFNPGFPPVADVLRRSGARVYARDAVSYDLVRPFTDAALAHDTAFFFDYAPYLLQGRGTLTAMRTDHARVADWEALGIDPATNIDVSRTATTLDEWLWWIARHSHVRTDRAHVMIAASMMGKCVTYHTTTDHKLDGIAELGTEGLCISCGDQG